MKVVIVVAVAQSRIGFLLPTISPPLLESALSTCSIVDPWHWNMDLVSRILGLLGPVQ